MDWNNISIELNHAHSLHHHQYFINFTINGLGSLSLR